MSFFKQFPKINYDLQETNVFSRRVDIFRHVDVASINTDVYTNYLFYEIKDGERPDIVSHKLYGTPDYYWTFFIINDFLQAGFNSWYKSQNDFHRGLDFEYANLGSLIFTPNYTTAANVLGGLDLTIEGLRFARVGSSPQDMAKISTFDPFMQSLRTSDATDPSFYDSGGTYHFAFSSDMTEVNKLDFLQKYTAHLKNIYDPEEDDSEGLPPEAATLVESNLTAHTYTPTRAYSSLLESPYRFKANTNLLETTKDDIDYFHFEEGELIGAVDALVNGYASIDSYQSWFEHELEENELKRKILYVSPSKVEGFVERYKNLINS